MAEFGQGHFCSFGLAKTLDFIPRFTALFSGCKGNYYIPTMLYIY